MERGLEQMNLLVGPRFRGSCGRKSSVPVTGNFAHAVSGFGYASVGGGGVSFSNGRGVFLFSSFPTASLATTSLAWTVCFLAPTMNRNSIRILGV